MERRCRKHSAGDGNCSLTVAATHTVAADNLCRTSHVCVEAAGCLAVSLGMAGCVVVALAKGRPWELRWPPPLVPRVLVDTPITVPVPRGLAESAHKDDVVFEERSSPLVVYCAPKRLDAPWGDPERRAYLADTAREIAAQPLDKGWSEEQPPRVAQLRGRPAVCWIVRSPDGRRHMTWLFLEGSWSLRLDVMLHPGAPAGWTSLPAAIAEGVRMPPAEE